MSLTLYRKYRPRIFGEVEGQEHVTRTLLGALSSGRISHAYLFCGPRGTGKTTLARLFAKSLNCKNYKADGLAPKERMLGDIPCNSCYDCEEINEGRSLDLIEIDAASNRGIDEIRNLKDSAQVAATGGGYKIFVVDECHMLTREANNALLKLLEEPPSHVIFILATTEPHKVPDTILSRVQRFDFKKITREQIIKKLERVAESEKLWLDPEALSALADHAAGSLRDAESALAKLVSYANPLESVAAGHGAAPSTKLGISPAALITGDQAAEILGLVPTRVHAEFLKAIMERRVHDAIAKINELYESGIDLENFTKQFIGHVRTVLISSVGGDPSGNVVFPSIKLIEVLNVFVRSRNELKNSPVPQLPLELAVMELAK